MAGNLCFGEKRRVILGFPPLGNTTYNICFNITFKNRQLLTLLQSNRVDRQVNLLFDGKIDVASLYKTDCWNGSRKELSVLCSLSLRYEFPKAHSSFVSNIFCQNNTFNLFIYSSIYMCYIFITDLIKKLKKIIRFF